MKIINEKDLKMNSCYIRIKKYNNEKITFAELLEKLELFAVEDRHVFMQDLFSFDIDKQDSDLDYGEMYYNVLNDFNKNKKVNIKQSDIARDVKTNNENTTISIFEYEEIKNYYLLFKKLYDQDIYKENRLKDDLDRKLNLKKLEEYKKVNKI